MGFNFGRGLVGLGTLGLSELVGEDAMSKMPILGPLGGYQSDEQKALLAKQKQMAEEAEKRRAQAQQERMNALGQQMLAFNPQNQLMAQMFGPGAAFTPDQFAQMTKDPGARSRAEYEQARAAAMANPQDHRIAGWTADDLKRMQENERRQAMVRQQMTPPGQGPQPFAMTPPMPGRKY